MEKGGNGAPSGGLGGFCPGGGDRGEEGGLCACGRLLDMVEVYVSPTTGGQFQLRVASSDSVDYLRRLVSKRLRVPKERICLLYRDRHLREGTLEENSIIDGAKITLLPSVETGLLTQRPEQSVMQALESLNDGQVNDFLTGKAPLNLTMRLGDHMMLIQLQLSTVSPTSSRKGSSSSSSRMSTSSSTSSPQHHEHHHYHHHHYHHHYHHSHSHPPSCSGGLASSTPVGTFTPSPSSNPWASGPNSPQSVLGVCGSSSPPASPSSSSIHHYHHHVTTSNSAGGGSPPSSPFLSTPPHHSHHHHHHHPNHQRTPSTPNTSPSTSSSSSTSSPLSELEPPIRGCPHQSGANGDPKASLDTKALAEASRNLTQTLKQLSSEVLTTKPTDKETSRPSSSVPERRKTPDRHVASSCSTSKASKRQGAIIESMHHHGKGVYSGTFSGTLNPALQDRQGRPKRDISTIIHILNDLLCATPQYRRHSSHSATSTSSAASSNSNSHSATLGSQSKQSTTSANLEEMFSAADEDSGVDDNQITRSKLEHLRLIMEQRRARRKARREARASPYAHPGATTSWSSETTTLVASKTTSTTSAATIATEGSAKAIEVEGSEKESGDASSLCEINTGTVVA